MNPTVVTGAPETLTKEDWVKYYWFSPLQMIDVINPAWAREGDNFVSKDYAFMVEMRHFMLPKGGHEELPGTIANVFLDGISKILAQNDDQLGFMGDPNLKRLYYDKLIVGIRSLVQEQSNVPAYLKNVPKSVMPEEKAPWDASLGERASDVATAPIAPPSIPQPLTMPQKTEVKPETKQFEFDGIKYKMIVAKDGRTMYYKNGSLTSEAEYSKAASM